MKIHYIAILMTSTLAVLFVLAKFLVPKEKRLMKDEGNYSEAVLKYKKEKEPSNDFKRVIIDLGKKIGKTDDQILKDIS